MSNLDGLAKLGRIGAGERDLMIVERNPSLPMRAGYALAAQLGLAEHQFIVFDNLAARAP